MTAGEQAREGLQAVVESLDEIDPQHGTDVRLAYEQAHALVAIGYALLAVADAIDRTGNA